MGTISILHCSDLHIGRVMMNAWYFKHRPLRHRNCHSSDLCTAMGQALEVAWKLTGLEPHADPFVICSGDLSASGSPKEFAVAHSLLRSHWRVQREPPGMAGLDMRGGSLGSPRFLAIPGNHDQWEGKGFRASVAYNSYLAPTHFRETPFPRVWRSESDDLRLELFGIDSNCGFPHGYSNYDADGRISEDHFDALEALLQEAPPPETPTVRAIVVHHSLRIPEGTPQAIQNGGRARLLDLADTYKVSAFLTGHVHSFAHEPIPDAARQLFELRSASATQAPTRRNPNPGFMVHKLERNGDQVHWSVWCCSWNQLGEWASTYGPKPDREFDALIV